MWCTEILKINCKTIIIKTSIMTTAFILIIFNGLLSCRHYSTDKIIIIQCIRLKNIWRQRHYFIFFRKGSHVSLRIFQSPYLIPVQEQFLDVEFQEIHEHFSSKTDVQKLGWMHCPIEWTLDRCLFFFFKHVFLVFFQPCFYCCPCLSHVLLQNNFQFFNGQNL